MNVKKTAAVILALISCLIICTACTKTAKIKNARANELFKEIEGIEYVQKVDAYHMGFNMIIDIYIEDGFEIENSGLKILKAARETLDSKIVNELKLEFEQEELPNTDMYIRNKDGEIQWSFIGNCYNSYHNEAGPVYEEYAWDISEWTKDGRRYFIEPDEEEIEFLLKDKEIDSLS